MYLTISFLLQQKYIFTIYELRARTADEAALLHADVTEKSEKIASQTVRVAELETEARALTLALKKLEEAHLSVSSELKTLRQNHVCFHNFNFILFFFS